MMLTICVALAIFLHELQLRPTRPLIPTLPLTIPHLPRPLSLIPMLEIL